MAHLILEIYRHLEDVGSLIAPEAGDERLADPEEDRWLGACAERL